MSRTARRLVLPLAAAIAVAGAAATYALAEPAGGGDCTVNADGVNMRELPNTDPVGVRGQEIHRRLYTGDRVNGVERADGWMRSTRSYANGEPPGVLIEGWIKENLLDCTPLPPPGEPTRLQ